MQLHSAIHGAGDGEDGEGLALEVQRRVRCVTDDEDMVFLGKVHSLLEKFFRGSGAGGVVRVVQIEQFRPFLLVIREGIQIRQVAVFLQQGQIDHFAAQILGPGAHNGVAGDGQQSDVAGVDEAAGEQGEGGFAADGVADFGIGIQFHAVKRLHVTGGGGLEVRAAVVGVDAVFPLFHFALHGIDDRGKRHVIRFAHAHIDQFHARIFRHGGTFGAFDLFKFVDLGIFAELIAADPVRKIALKETFCHFSSPELAGFCFNRHSHAYNIHFNW